MLLSIQDACPSLQRIVSVSEGSLPNPVKSLKEILDPKEPPSSSFPELQTKDLLILLYTSGTVGNPKGVMCQQNYWHIHIIGRRTRPPLEYDESDRMLVYVPLLHNLGLHLLTVVVIVDGTVVLVGHWHSTQFWDWVKNYNVHRTFFLGFTVYTLTQNPKTEDPKTHPIKKWGAY
jgi:acyl-CoA synthetase (AMP-forming)/AMP-acid ligase II